MLAIRFSSIASEGDGLDALVYLSPQAGKQVKSNMQALVSPTTVEKSEYGSIYGKVTQVLNFHLLLKKWLLCYKTRSW